MDTISAVFPARDPQTVAFRPTVTQTAISEDDELDKIMRDVGAQLKKEEIKPAKRRLFSYGHKPRREVPFTAQIVHNPQQYHKPPHAPAQPERALATPVTELKPQPRPVGRPADAAEAQLSKIEAHPQTQPAAKPKKQTSYPVFVLFVTFLMTGFLIVAAIAAYRQ
jgi:hypothetical protein